jgi:predicted phosphodiesterase
MLGTFIADAGKVTEYSIHVDTAIPVGATRLLAVNTANGRYMSFILPKERLLTGEKLYSFGALSDTHQGTRYGEESLSLQRLINAGKILSQKGAILVGINGDIANDNIEREYYLHGEAIKEIFAFDPTMPIYTVSGNHEAKYTGFSREWYLKYTRNVVDYKTTLTPVFADDNDLDFVVEMPDGSVIIFLHQIYYDYGKTTSRLMDDSQLDWLGDRLEQYKDKKVFLFFHSQMQGKVGDFNGVDALTMLPSTEDYKRLDAYFKQYTNVVFFNGHSHGSFDTIFLEKYGDRIFNTYGGEYATLAHIPSLANSSLGYIVHVYEDCVVFEGYNFSKEQSFAYATFIIEK